ncbi:MAG: hypothetical protein CL874_02585 [Dehalococcoidales bacterium]|jgi:membrane protein YqaA with SNARE-associated domain|nr:hypothetical protein [Dehalococcoidales bacterium]MDP6576320.1 VTT domain-containing protein [Dehalococcoidales bacterium]
MNKAASDDESGLIRKGVWIKEIILPFFILLLVSIISIGVYYFYRQVPDRFEELAAYGYLGAFLISLILNATVILPVGNVLAISTLGAILPSAIMVGLAGGVGAAIGEITGYMAGYSGRGFVQKSRVYQNVEGWVRRWGVPSLFIFSSIPFIFDLAAIAAGALRFPFWKFFILCWLGRTMSYIIVAWIGTWSWVVVVVLASLALGSMIVRRIWRRAS